jgi:CubicO group peptidase (beta-lactamase class C family)
MISAALLAMGLAAEATDWPTAGWRESKPEAQELDLEALERLSQEFAQGRRGYVDGMLVIRNARLVFERSYPHDYAALFAKAPDRTPGLYNYYDAEWHPFFKKTPLHTLQSVSKSVTSALLGIALRQGELRGVDVPVSPFFEGYRMQAGDPRWQALRLEHLLTMTSGIRWDEDSVPYTDPANSCAAMEASKDWVQFVLEQPMAAEPGSRFVYSSGVTELLAQVLKSATGRQADEYAAEHLFPPLGIERFHWKRTPTGHSDTEGGLYLEPRDLAKLGYLYLKDGVWNGQRVLAEGWVAASTRAAIAVNDQSGFKYGYQWWVLPPTARRPPAFAAIGYGGQYLVVVPDLELIAVFTGWNIYDQPELDIEFALDGVLKAVKDRREAQ